jgi:hypothetical protein
MADQSDVRRLASTLPEVEESAEHFAFSVRGKGFAWVWLERPHYNGFPAVLVRLAVVDDAELMELLTDAWRCRAPKRLVQESGL